MSPSNDAAGPDTTDAPALTVTDAVADNSIAQSTFETGDTSGSFINGTVDGLQTAFNSDSVGTGFNVASNG